MKRNDFIMTKYELIKGYIFMAQYLVKHRDNFTFEICCFPSD